MSTTDKKFHFLNNSFPPFVPDWIGSDPNPPFPNLSTPVLVCGMEYELLFNTDVELLRWHVCVSMFSSLLPKTACRLNMNLANRKYSNVNSLSPTFLHIFDFKLLNAFWNTNLCAWISAFRIILFSVVWCVEILSLKIKLINQLTSTKTNHMQHTFFCKMSSFKILPFFLRTFLRLSFYSFTSLGRIKMGCKII